MRWAHKKVSIWCHIRSEYIQSISKRNGKINLSNPISFLSLSPCQHVFFLQISLLYEKIHSPINLSISSMFWKVDVNIIFIMFAHKMIKRFQLDADFMVNWMGHRLINIHQTNTKRNIHHYNLSLWMWIKYVEYPLIIDLIYRNLCFMKCSSLFCMHMENKSIFTIACKHRVWASLSSAQILNH